MTRLLVESDLSFSVTVDGEEMSGTLTGSGSDLHLHLEDPRMLGGAGPATIRSFAAQLARLGVRLSVSTDGPLVTLGDSGVSFWQRRVTRSPHLRVASAGAAVRLMRQRRASTSRSGRPGVGSLLPPGTPLPMLPTFLRRPRRPTTTHDPDRGGYPRLHMAPSEHMGPHWVQPVFGLGDRTTVGSHPSCDIVLAGLEPLHAEVRRTPEDEFVVVRLEAGHDLRVHGAPVLTQALLRTGTRVQLGRHTLTFVREEYADHGRPYGGRVGGELGHQRSQPPLETTRSRLRAVSSGRPQGGF